MGQKVHPLGFRLGVYEDWQAHWFAKKGSYGVGLLEDIKMRNFLLANLDRSEIAKIVIDKAGDNVKIVLFSGRPGSVIGKKGQGILQLRDAMYKEFNKQVDISVQEIKVPEANAQLVAISIAEQLEKRANVKKLMKKAGFAAIKSGTKGIKICCSGRLGGAEIARIEWLKLGSIPLHTLRSHIEYACAEAKTTYGLIGVKVWICKGEY
ncbi:TPA: 30S ribosomal protein S3 [Candidatus Dependentiae bacterium]|nr:MAG: 30S ribosomal protein S3 [candidate division TM6 bacterium GW2011_GWE2_31_21]KKP53121.1 MAG: 30S ribosomal protein S3 [candidate division TM6 bacterium GW2011_GWF2_33_332]HBS47940.1 30S ribosomal protein S3 [Candidatus Dependentiae bacterium]HBZ73456.1 30S ribosomal protein S3 [Candidatus Dependentiae bacterium]